ncbi:MAG: alpha/beta hydrolase [Candidatus Acetothermia bacterium]|jgi:pimeloyl-ACP methyl ester carboxylesterase|nr:alpha/beta hydrolase [Candidatus Acetothermia bacterium]MDH7504788.1 alpha/beta fold hydrolase [Candidatus Acetothermia bacterium]
MPKVRANGIDIYYEVHGPAEGEPLVLIAGLGYDHWMWHRMVPGLAEHLQVIIFDNRGVGQTDKPLGPYTAQLLADDTAGLLQALGISRAAVLGHSMGGFVAQALVLSRPELVSKLILAATNFGGPRHIPITPEALAVLTDMTGDPLERLRRGIVISTAPGFAEREPELVREWLTYRAKNPLDPAAYQAQMAVGLALLSEEASFEKKLKGVRIPTLILFGEHDRVVPPGNADLLAKAIPNSTVRILKDAGHFFPLEAPEAAVKVVLEFLKE